MRNPLHALCPYFAMFPETFVEDQLQQFTTVGDLVFDPFSGRGTTLLQALLMKRSAAASDINPVAYVVSAAKAEMPRAETLKAAIDALESGFADSACDQEREQLPAFFGRAFHWATLNELLFLRKQLRWRTNRSHGFLAALVLGALHGEMGRSDRYFSNQMPRTISPKPVYALGYWRNNDLWPQRRRVFERLREDVDLRLEAPPEGRGSVSLADVRGCHRHFPALAGKVSAVVTSPPYFNVTCFEEDQWLRLWFLGRPPRPTYRTISRDDRYEVKGSYWKFLREAWAGVRPLLKPGAVMVCRLGGTGIEQRELTVGIMESVRSAFPHAQLMKRPQRTEIQRRQTDAFRPNSVGCRFEVDYSIQLSKPRTRGRSLSPKRRLCRDETA